MDDRIFVQRANVILEVKAEDKDFYMQNGYSVIDQNGTVLEKAMSNDVNELRVQVKELTEKLAQANATIAELRKAQEQVQASVKPATPVTAAVPERRTRRTRA